MSKSHNDQRALIEILRRKAQGWLRYPNVTSVGVGYKIVEGKKTDRLCIQVTVAKKYTDDELKKLHIEPLLRNIPVGRGRSIPVDVIARKYRRSYEIVPEPPGTIFALPPIPNDRIRRRRRLPRIMPGISISSRQGMAGTIGAIVYSNRTAEPCVLSNAHVLATGATDIAGPIVQPGRFDDGQLDQNTMGRLISSHIGLAGDCAICSIEGRVFDETILGLNVAPKRLAKVAVDDIVTKSGRTTGVTRGIVERIGVVVKFDYGDEWGIQNVGCFEIKKTNPADENLISDEGDSGSLWVIEENNAPTDIAAGLHFAVEDHTEGGQTALACDISSVFQKLDISFTSIA